MTNNNNPHGPATQFIAIYFGGNRRKQIAQGKYNAASGNLETVDVKQYGSHDYINVTYFDMLNNSGILSAINPVHLMDIHLHEYLLKQENEKYHITETLRNNQYKIANTKIGEIYSGEHICRNVDMFSNIAHADLCKIAYQSGFIKGRRTSVEIKNLLERKQKEAQEKAFSENERQNVGSLTAYRAGTHQD